MTTAERAVTSRDMRRHEQELDEQGYTIVEHAISDEFADELREAVFRLEAQIGDRHGSDRFRGLSTIKVQNLLGKEPGFRRLAMNEYTRHLVEYILGPGFLVTTNMSTDILPGEKYQPLHVDDMYYGSKISRPHIPLACNTLWALTDFTADNGATMVLPGSHLRIDTPGDNISEIIDRVDERPDGLIPSVMPKGSVVVFQGALWHGGGANTTDARRVGIAMNHCAGWLRPEHNNLLIMPLEEVRALEPELQDMLGFGVYENVIGRIDAMPPLEALALQGR